MVAGLGDKTRAWWVFSGGWSVTGTVYDAYRDEGSLQDIRLGDLLDAALRMSRAELRYGQQDASRQRLRISRPCLGWVEGCDGVRGQDGLPSYSS